MLVPDPAMPTGERVKILDFGLAKLSEVHEAANVKTNSQAVIGTPLYMSPEQCEGAGRIDSKTDVYSLGCMLYELLSGKPPFVGTGPGQVIGMHLFMEPVPLSQQTPSVPAALSELVGKLLTKVKEQRPAMREVQRSLELLAADLPPPPRRQESADHAESDGELDPAKLADLAMAPTMGSAPGEPKAAAATSPAAGAAAALVATLSADLDAPPVPPPSEALKGVTPVVTSTLGRSAAEKIDPAPRRRPSLWAAGGLAVLCLGGGLAVLLHKPAVPAVVVPEGPAQRPPQPQPQPHKSVQLRVVSNPAGAAVIRSHDKTVLGVTPWEHEQEPEAGTLTVILQAPGYMNQEASLNLATGGVTHVTLLPVAAPPSSEPEAGGPRSKRRAKTHHVAQPKPGEPAQPPAQPPGHPPGHLVDSPGAAAAAPPAAKSPDPVAPAPPAKVPEKRRARPLPIED